MASKRRPESPPAAEPTPEGEAFKLQPDTPEQEPSKMDAVREALKEGFDSPEEGINFLQAKYGFTMSRPMFSTYKANIKRKETGGSGATGRAPAASGDMFEVLKGMKELVGAYGAQKVKDMVDLVS